MECGAQKLPAAHRSALPQRASTLPRESNTLTRPPPQLRHVDQTVAINVDRGGALHVGPLLDELAIRAEDLNAVVFTVRDEDSAIRRGPDAVWQVELARPCAWLPPGLDQLS